MKVSVIIFAWCMAVKGSTTTHCFPKVSKMQIIKLQYYLSIFLSQYVCGTEYDIFGQTRVVLPPINRRMQLEFKVQSHTKRHIMIGATAQPKYPALSQ